MLKLPSEASGESILCRTLSRLTLEFKTDVKHRIDCVGDVSTAFTLDVTLKLSCKSSVDYTVARYVRRTPRCGMNLIQSCYEKFVCILLCVSGEVSSCSPCRS